jgi:hypothetical protein
MCGFIVKIMKSSVYEWCGVYLSSLRVKNEFYTSTTLFCNCYVFATYKNIFTIHDLNLLFCVLIHLWSVVKYTAQFPVAIFSAKSMACGFIVKIMKSNVYEWCGIYLSSLRFKNEFYTTTTLFFVIVMFLQHVRTFLRSMIWTYYSVFWFIFDQWPNMLHNFLRQYSVRNPWRVRSLDYWAGRDDPAGMNWYV